MRRARWKRKRRLARSGTVALRARRRSAYRCKRRFCLAFGHAMVFCEVDTVVPWRMVPTSSGVVIALASFSFRCRWLVVDEGLSDGLMQQLLRPPRQRVAERSASHAFLFGPCNRAAVGGSAALRMRHTPCGYSPFLFWHDKREMGGASRWTSPLREQASPWPPQRRPASLRATAGRLYGVRRGEIFRAAARRPHAPQGPCLTSKSPAPRRPCRASRRSDRTAGSCPSMPPAAGGWPRR